MIYFLLLLAPVFGEELGLPGLPLGGHSKPPMICPRSRSPLHAYAKVQTHFKHSCETVQEEIKGRLKGEMTNKGHPWMDPHNGGTYYDLGMYQYEDKKKGMSYMQMETERRNAHRNIVGTYFHDKQYFTFVPMTSTGDVRSRRKGGNDGGECMVYACSASQGPSATDGGTNFCNMHDLYCNSMDNCEWVHTDLNYKEVKKSANIGSRTNKWICTGRPPRYELFEDNGDEETEVTPAYMAEAEFWLEEALRGHKADREATGMEAPVKQSS